MPAEQIGLSFARCSQARVVEGLPKRACARVKVSGENERWAHTRAHTAAASEGANHEGRMVHAALAAGQVSPSAI
jgi:hypothetical protein